MGQYLLPCSSELPKAWSGTNTSHLFSVQIFHIECFILFFSSPAQFHWVGVGADNLLFWHCLNLLWQFLIFGSLGDEGSSRKCLWKTKLLSGLFEPSSLPKCIELLFTSSEGSMAKGLTPGQPSGEEKAAVLPQFLSVRCSLWKFPTQHSLQSLWVQTHNCLLVYNMPVKPGVFPCTEAQEGLAYLAWSTHSTTLPNVPSPRLPTISSRRENNSGCEHWGHAGYEALQFHSIQVSRKNSHGYILLTHNCLLSVSSNYCSVHL